LLRDYGRALDREATEGELELELEI
jgi:hypothetical protein